MGRYKGLVADFSESTGAQWHNAEPPTKSSTQSPPPEVVLVPWGSSLRHMDRTCATLPLEIRGGLFGYN